MLLIFFSKLLKASEHAKLIILKLILFVHAIEIIKNRNMLIDYI